MPAHSDRVQWVPFVPCVCAGGRGSMPTGDGRRAQRGPPPGGRCPAWSLPWDSRGEMHCAATDTGASKGDPHHENNFRHHRGSMHATTPVRSVARHKPRWRLRAAADDRYTSNNTWTPVINGPITIGQPLSCCSDADRSI